MASIPTFEVQEMMVFLAKAIFSFDMQKLAFSATKQQGVLGVLLVLKYTCKY